MARLLLPRDRGRRDVNEFGLVDDDNQLLVTLAMISRAGARRRALQKIETADIDLVCPVDRDVDLIMFCQRGEWNTQTTSLALRLL